MANPVAQAMTFDSSKSSDQSGACRDFWIRIPGLGAASDCDTASLLYYLENPYCEDLVMLEALVTITTEDAQDGDIDIGLCDAAAGTDSSDTSECICDSMVNTAAGVFAVLGPNALACTQGRYIWKAKGASTDSFLSVTQNTDADVSALKWNLALRVMPYKDLLNTGINKSSVTVA